MAQPVTCRDHPINPVIQLLFKLGGRIRYLGPALFKGSDSGCSTVKDPVQ